MKSSSASAGPSSSSSTSGPALIEVRDLHVSVQDRQVEKPVLKGLSLTIRAGEVHAIMGRNGAGKTTLSHAMMGHPAYRVTSGSIWFEGENITELSPEDRAKKRMFLSFQYPVSIPGVTVSNFLRASLRAVRGDEIPSGEVRKRIKAELKELKMDEAFISRGLNEGFSGGEKKRLETLQMRLLEPKFAILDETDSGLDIDALRTVSERIQSLRSPERGILMITHYQRMLDYVKPDFVHVLLDGKIVRTGGADLALELEQKGYDWLGTGAPA